MNDSTEIPQEVNPWNGEEMLLSATMARAVDDYRHLRELQAQYGNYDNAPHDGVRKAWDAGVDAQVWFQSKNTEPMSFLAICLATNLNPRLVLAALDKCRPEDNDADGEVLPELAAGEYQDYIGAWVTRREEPE